MSTRTSAFGGAAGVNSRSTSALLARASCFWSSRRLAGRSARGMPERGSSRSSSSTLFFVRTADCIFVRYSTSSGVFGIGRSHGSSLGSPEFAKTL
jgi:hypothetical protein